MSSLGVFLMTLATTSTHAQDSNKGESTLRILLSSVSNPDQCRVARELRSLQKKLGRKSQYTALVSAEMLRAEASCKGTGPSEEIVASPTNDRVRVPAGEFLRGSSNTDILRGLRLCRDTYFNAEECNVAWFKSETPQRSIELDQFLIDRTEVSNARYETCVTAGACTPIAWDSCSKFDPRTRTWSTSAPGTFNARDPNYPVVCVTWAQAQAFCHYTGGQLPTEAQWEKAARGADGRSFPWGNAWTPKQLNWGDLTSNGAFGSIDGSVGASQIGTYPANTSPFGALDMAGNVWEWTADWFSHNYYSRSPNKNPVNQNMSPDKGRVVRGGSWSFAGNGARTTYRYYQPPETLDDAIGFRCVYTP